MHPLTSDPLSLSFLSGRVGSGSVPVATNLLRWTEAFDNAVWGKVDVAATANAATAPDSNLTADRLTFSVAGQILQTTTVAVASGAAVAGSASVDTTWQRFAVTRSFDSLPYTFSIYLKADSPGLDINYRIFRSGGFLVVDLVDISELGPEIYAWGAQLEQSAFATAYVPRTT